MAEHAKEVSELLPGGLEVVGVFLVSPTDTLRALQPRLRKLVGEVCSHPHLPPSTLSPPPHMNRILLHFCTKTKKHKCQTMDLADRQAVFRPAELRFQPHCSKWHRVECSIALHINTHTPSTSPLHTNQLQRSVQEGLHPTLASIASALVTVRGRPCQLEDPLVRPPSQKKSTAVRGETVPVAMYLRKPSQPASRPPQLMGQVRRLRLKGQMRCLAFVHPKATCGEAITAIKTDAARSLLGRCEALCKDIEAERMEKMKTGTNSTAVMEEGGSVLSLRQLPRRVLVTLPSSELPLSGYCFPDEPDEEFRSNVAELLSVDLADLTLEHVERFPAPPTPVEFPATSVTVESSEIAHSQKGSLLPLTGLAVSISVALVAVTVWALQDLLL